MNNAKNSLRRKSKVVVVNHKLELLSIAQLSKLGITFWVGGTLTIAIIIIPLLFKILDQITATRISGQILNINAYCGIVAIFFGVIEVILQHKLSVFKARRLWYLLLSATILIINYFALFPIIARLRTKLADVVHHVIQPNPSLNFWHSISSLLFVLTAILGVLYILEKE